MADTKQTEREYIIPLRRFWLRKPQYERSRRAVKAIKNFIAKHMKVPERDISKVKLNIYFNNELWFRGRAHPPGKVKVKARREGDIIKVDFAETPEYVKFLKQKHERLHKKTEKKVVEKPAEIKPEEKTEEQKKAEIEKEKSVEEQNIKEAEQKAKAEKHVTKTKAPRIQRMALKK